MFDKEKAMTYLKHVPAVAQSAALEWKLEQRRAVCQLYREVHEINPLRAIVGDPMAWAVATDLLTFEEMKQIELPGAML
jgi:hypothetical protein